MAIKTLSKVWKWRLLVFLLLPLDNLSMLLFYSKRLRCNQDPCKYLKRRALQQKLRAFSHWFCCKVSRSLSYASEISQLIQDLEENKKKHFKSTGKFNIMILWMRKCVNLVIFLETDHIQQEMEIKNNVAANYLPWNLFLKILVN